MKFTQAKFLIGVAVVLCSFISLLFLIEIAEDMSMHVFFQK